MLMHSLPGRAEYRSDWHCFVHLRHMALLAATLCRIVTVQPLEIRHLLRKFADCLPVRSSRFGVERVTGSAQGRITGGGRLRGQETAGGSIHDPLAPALNIERSIFGVAVM